MSGAWGGIFAGGASSVEGAQAFERVFDAVPLGIVVVDGDGVLRWANRAFASMLGRERAELDGLALEQTSHPDAREREATANALAALRAGRTVAPFEKRYLAKDGSTVWARVSTGAVRSAEGEFRYAISVLEDITASRSAGSALGVSEERFRVLVEMSPDAIMLFINGVVVSANPAAARLLGATDASEIIGRASRDIVHRDSIPAVERRVQRVARGEDSGTLEERYVRLDGTTVPVEVTANAFPHPSNRAFVVLARDISARLEAEEQRQKEREALAAAQAAKEGERLLRLIVDAMPNGVFARDRDGRYVLINRAAAELFGCVPAQIVGRTVGEFRLADTAESVLAEDRALLDARAGSIRAETSMVDARGVRRVFEQVRLPFSLRGGAPDTVLGVLTELTERKRLELKLTRSQRLESLGQLAGGIAHDFNNLLTVILGSVDYLADAGVDDPDVERVREGARRAAALTKQLLAFARQSPVEPLTVSLNDLVARTAKLLERVLGEDIVIATALDEAPTLVRVDPGQMEQVLMNLAVNARDAMPRGGELSFSTRVVPSSGKRSSVELLVRDNGEGMGEEVLAHIFEPFFTTKEVGKGTGLGLAMCYGIVEQFGGSITVESAPGQGTTFSIQLPAVAAESKPATVPPPARARDAAPRGNVVLVIEDDPMVRDVTVRMLRQLGCEVLSASLPSEALAVAAREQGPIDLIVTDVVMPEMSGVEVARRIMRDRPDTRVIFVSGYTDDQLADAELVHRLAKPFTRDDLAQKIRALLG